LLGLTYWGEVGPYPVEVLSPLLREPDYHAYPAKPGLEANEADESGHSPGPLRRLWRRIRRRLVRARVIRPLETAIHQNALNASLTAAKALEIFNGHKPTSPDVVADVSAIPNLTQASAAAAELISGTQMRQNRRSRWSFYWLAGFFVLALLAFEIYAKFDPNRWYVLSGYLLLLLMIAVVVLLARWNLSQAKSEDYRAVAEMMRVQHAWWSAGIPNRVDREHLQGADRDLARIRDGTTSVIAWLLIRHGLKKPTVNWSEVRANLPTDRTRTRAPGESDDWVGSQLAYFSSKQKAREDHVHRADATSWTLFIASAVMAGILCVWVADAQHWGDRVFRFSTWVSSRLKFDGATWAAGLSIAAWALAAYLALRFRIANRDLKGLPAILATLGLGLIMGSLLSLAILELAPLLQAGAPQATAVKLMMVVLIGLSAAAGARRYLLERLNIEAEAHDYRNARQRFERAEHLLWTWRGDAGEPTNPTAARKLVIDLGHLALAENEAWLKSRRERPLTPVVG
jgi:MFS family permease